MERSSFLDFSDAGNFWIPAVFRSLLHLYLLLKILNHLQNTLSTLYSVSYHPPVLRSSSQLDKDSARSGECSHFPSFRDTVLTIELYRYSLKD